MQQTVILSLLFTGLWCLAAGGPLAAEAPATDAEPEKAAIFPDDFSLEGPVLIELFTSEGCSSCPPADAAFTRLVDEARSKGLDVHLLAWHVDYWNKLKTRHGTWQDPFSSRDFTKRQQTFAVAFQKLGIFKQPRMVTPQMIVNGRPYRALAAQGLDTGSILTGMAAKAGGVSIAASVAEAPAATDDAETEDGTTDLVVEWSMAGEAWDPAASSVTIAAIESGVASEITAGENHGQSMVHDHLVRAAWMGRVEADTGATTLTLPADWQGEDAAVLVAVHDAKLVLRAVTRLPITKPAGDSQAAKDAAAAGPTAAVVAAAGTCETGAGCAGCGGPFDLDPEAGSPDDADDSIGTID